jgi:hypothetical protein
MEYADTEEWVRKISEFLLSLHLESAVPLPSYTAATLPSSSDFEGSLAYINDEAAGVTPAFYDGTEWVRLASRHGYSISAEDYGVTADGSTDDTAAVQAAMDAAVANGGGVVLLPAGTIKITAPLTHNSSTPITLQGSNRRASTLTASGNFLAILNIQASTGLVVRDIDFNCGATTTKAVDVDAGAVDTLFERCKYRGSASSGTLIFAEGDFLEFVNSHFVVSNAALVACELDGNNQAAKFRGCRFSGTGRGLKISSTSSDVEGIRVVDSHFVNTGTWAVTLNGVLDAAFIGCTFDQQSTSGVILSTDADRVSFQNCWFGAALANTTATLLDITAVSGSQIIVMGCRFFYGAKAIHARATASAGEYLRELVVTGCMFNGQYSTCLQLDSVLQCSVIGNTDNGTPANGSWITLATNAVNGNYTFDCNHWHTQAPVVFATAAAYQWGLDTGIVMRAEGVHTVSGAATTDNITHGLSRTPTKVQLTPGTSVGDWYAGTMTSTVIPVTWATSGEPVWYWTASV